MIPNGKRRALCVVLVAWTGCSVGSLDSLLTWYHFDVAFWAQSKPFQWVIYYLLFIDDIFASHSYGSTKQWHLTKKSQHLLALVAFLGFRVKSKRAKTQTNVWFKMRIYSSHSLSSIVIQCKLPLLPIFCHGVKIQFKFQ